MRTRIKDERIRAGLSRTELAACLGVGVTSISNWESGDRTPPAEMLIKIAEFFDVTLDYLLCKEEQRQNTIDPNDKLTKRHLLIMHGEPVWVPGSDARDSSWALVNAGKKTLMFADGRSLTFDELNSEIYAYPPAFVLSLRGVGSPLSKEQLNAFAGKSIWVEPISVDPILRNELRGWYRVYDRYAENEIGQRFFHSMYGSKWLAFTECVEDS